METEKTKVSTADWWKILKGPISLPDALRLTGMAQDRIDVYVDKNNSVDDYFFFVQSLQRMAYENLVHLGEISDQEIWSWHDKPRHADLGFKGKETWRYDHKNGWEFGF